jgi:hypothetical protein
MNVSLSQQTREWIISLPFWLPSIENQKGVFLDFTGISPHFTSVPENLPEK